MPRILFWKALFGLIAFDMLRLGHSFPRMHTMVSGWQVAQRIASDNLVRQVCQAVNYSCVCYPKRVLCLQRSAVTTCLLRSCGVPAQMVMGAQTLPFKAHAWTEVNGLVVNEPRDVKTIYSVLERC
jgi:hypothetical protein